MLGVGRLLQLLMLLLPSVQIHLNSLLESLKLFEPSSVRSSYYLTVAAADIDCSRKDKEGQICNHPNAFVCHNRTCQSACAVKHKQPCSCPLESDRACYLCCGSYNSVCQPAHKIGLFTPNGQRWESDTCKYCSQDKSYDGMPCDDQNRHHYCLDGKCVGTICLGRPEGEVCGKQKQNICLEGKCEAKCGRYLQCDCPATNEIGEPSEHRCQLCCFDVSTKTCKPATHFNIRHKNRPIVRTGLDCLGGLTCNRYGICAGANLRAYLSVLLLTTLALLIR